MRIGVHLLKFVLHVTCISRGNVGLCMGRYVKCAFCFASGQNVLKSLRFCSPKPASRGRAGPTAAVQQGAPSPAFPYFTKESLTISTVRQGDRAGLNCSPPAHRPGAGASAEAANTDTHSSSISAYWEPGLRVESPSSLSASLRRRGRDCFLFLQITTPMSSRRAHAHRRSALSQLSR